MGSPVVINEFLILLPINILNVHIVEEVLEGLSGILVAVESYFCYILFLVVFYPIFVIPGERNGFINSYALV